MIFLSSWVLWAGLALAIPIIIHLFNFRKPKRLLFSNVAFVREINRSVLRRVRLQHWLLLASRILTLLALVLLFAGPIWSRQNAEMNAGAKSVLILIDNSPSMQMADEKGVFLWQAQKMAQVIISQAGSQDEFLVLPTSELRPAQPFQRGPEANARLQQIQGSPTGASLAQVIKSASRLLEKAVMPDKVIYFISDFQSQPVLGDSLIDPSSEIPFRLVCLPIQGNHEGNLFLHTLSLPDPVMDPDQSVMLQTEIFNQSETLKEKVNVNLHLEGKSAGSLLVDLPPQSSQTLNIPLNIKSITPSPSGWYSGYLEVEDALNAFDNRRYFSLHMPDTSEILVVEGENTDQQYLQRLFKKVFLQYKFKFVPENKWADENPDKYPAIILSGVNKLSGGMPNRLLQYLTSGGNVLVFMSAKAEVSGWNGWLTATGAGSLSASQSLSPPQQIKKIETSNPLFDKVFQEKSKGILEGPLVYRRFPLTPAPNLIPIIQFSDGLPLLGELSYQKGRLLLFTIFPDGNDSDLPLKTLFPPLMYKALLRLTHTSTEELSFVSNPGLRLPLRTPDPDIVTLQPLPTGEKIIPEQFARNGEISLTFSQLSPTPGNYQVLQENRYLKNISVNLEEKESFLSFSSPQEIQSKLSGLSNPSQYSVLDTQLEQLSNDLAAESAGYPVWKIFLWIAIFGLALECYLMFRSQHQIKSE